MMESVNFGLLDHSLEEVVVWIMTGWGLPGEFVCTGEEIRVDYDFE